jgi:hypothetical protein
MDCCGHGHVLAHRPWMWSPASTSVGAMLGGGAAARRSTADQTPETVTRARHHVKRLNQIRQDTFHQQTRG